MKKYLLYALGFYISSVVIHVTLGWLMENNIVPTNSFKEIKRLDIKELKEKKTFAIEYIRRTDQIYILTEKNKFYAINLKTHKIVYEANLSFLKDVKDMKCEELKCMFAQDKELFLVDFFNFGHFAKVPNVQKITTLENSIDKIESYNRDVVLRDNKDMVHFFDWDNGRFTKTDEKKLSEFKTDCDYIDTTKGSIFATNQTYCKKFLSIYVQGSSHAIGFLDFRFIKDITIDDEVFYSSYGGKNVLFIAHDDYIYQAKTEFSIFRIIDNILRPIAYLPLLPFLGKQ